ncbi:PQQ-binding-like beta-propeller repeat protein [Actinoplanes oblitus]|uniref:PQQ-binding-like beta-propeller repeat protein n=1 Tax=Actinoplanes oblitus TaxID=3040509 RepID=A0ABY8W4W8_9ACTN|nr:PQQ-binding-like beta-propeller repeat protein [Actinoplanes oblitus]WIM92899.1 PQQ-binding-like beta-propeller repeat protein [Actinoplanes oblitus]
MPGEAPSLTFPLPFVPSLLLWSDDGSRLVACGSFWSFVDFGTPGLAVVDSATGAVTWQLTGLNCTAAQVAGSRLAVCQFVSSPGGGVLGEGRVAAFDLMTGQQLWLHDQLFGAGIAADPGGRWLAVTAADHYAILALEDGTELSRVVLRPLPRFRPLISPTGLHLAVADATRMVIADLPSGAIRHELPTAAPTITADFDEAGETLTMVCRDASVTVVDVASGRPVGHAVLADAHLPAGSGDLVLLAGWPVALSPDRRVVAVTGTTGTATFAARTGARIGSTPGPTPLGARTAYSPDARLLATTRVTTHHQVMTAPSAQVVREQRLDARAAATFHRSGRVAIGYRAEGRGMLQIDAPGNGLLRQVAVAPGTPVRGVDVTLAAMPDAVGTSGTELLVSASDRIARLHTAASGELLFERSHPAPLTDIALLRGGASFVTACTDGGVRLFDTVTGAKRWGLSHASAVNALAVDPAGEVVFSAGSDKTVRGIEAATGTELWRVTLPRGVARVAVSADGRFLLVACADRTARALEIADGAERWQVPHDGAINALATGAATVATACEDGSVRALACETGAIIRTVGHVRAPTSVAFSPDGQTMISGSLDGAVLASSVPEPDAAPERLTTTATPVTQIARGEGAMVVVTEDGTVRIIDVRLRAELARFFHDAAVHDVAVDTRNGLLVTGAADGVVRVWEWPATDRTEGMS